MSPLIVDFDQPPADPVAWLRGWLDDAQTLTLPNPNAMTLATVDPDGRPSARIVLLKTIDDAPPPRGAAAGVNAAAGPAVGATGSAGRGRPPGAVFYTNLGSRKAEALRAHPHAALLFHWDALDRQVRIEGGVSAVNDAEADAYFATRPRLSQIGAWSSAQSREVPGGRRESLEVGVAGMLDRFTAADGGELPVPRPPHWGGYRVAMERIEFWQGHPFRLHDRVMYTRGSDGSWTTRRLWP